MKMLSIILGILFLLQSSASLAALLCNDKNSQSVFQLQLSDDLTTSKLITIIADSSVLGNGTKDLKLQEGESTPELSTYAGRTNSKLHIALIFNAQKASSLKTSETLQVNAFYQQQEDDKGLSGNTILLCSNK